MAAVRELPMLTDAEFDGRQQSASSGPVKASATKKSRERGSKFSCHRHELLNTSNFMDLSKEKYRVSRLTQQP